jgi:uncharacterized membrane protein YphA (DoxX/SURF4 family)
MTITRRIGRPLLSGIFIVGGLDAARNPDNKVKKAERVTKPLSEMAPEGFPTDTETLVRVNGIVQVVAGTALAIGKFRRLAALALIGSIIPTTAAGHRFWEETDDEARAQQMIHFLKNLGLLGGLIIAAADTDGAPSLGWRARRRAQRLGQAVSVGGALASTKAGSARRSGRRATRRAAKVTPVAVATAATARRQAKRSIDTVGSQVHVGADKAGQLIATGADLAGQLISTGSDRAGQLIATGTDLAGQLISTGSDRAGHLLSSGSDRAGDLVAAAKNVLPLG